MVFNHFSALVATYNGLFCCKGKWFIFQSLRDKRSNLLASPFGPHTEKTISQFCLIKPNLDYKNIFVINLETNRILLEAKSIRKIKIWFNLKRLRNRFLGVHQLLSKVTAMPDDTHKYHFYKSRYT